MLVNNIHDTQVSRMVVVTTWCRRVCWWRTSRQAWCWSSQDPRSRWTMRDVVANWCSVWIPFFVSGWVTLDPPKTKQKVSRRKKKKQHHFVGQRQDLLIIFAKCSIGKEPKKKIHRGGSFFLSFSPKSTTSTSGGSPPLLPLRRHPPLNMSAQVSRQTNATTLGETNKKMVKDGDSYIIIISWCASISLKIKMCILVVN